MGAVLSPKAWEDNSQAKLEYLEGLVGRLTQEKLESLESEVKALTSERANLRGQLSQYDETVKAIKAEAAARIEAANKSHADGSNRQRGVWESQVSELRFQNNKLAAEKLAASKEVDNLKSEVSRLKSEVKSKEIKLDMLEQMNSKLDQILEIVRGMAESGAAPERIVEVIQDVKNETSRIEKIKALVELEAQGFTSAKELLPKLEHLGVKYPSRISELRKSKEYKQLKGGDSNVET